MESSSAGTTSAPGDSTTQEPHPTDSEGAKLDAGDPGTGQPGCDKVDFLFVVDNSASMEEEQVQLIASFAGFIDAIRATLQTQDYHIMVVDTDAESLKFDDMLCADGACTCAPEPQCCVAACANVGPIPLDPPPDECEGSPCEEFPRQTGCAVTLGAGKAEDPLGASCNLDDGARFVTNEQSELEATFECIARVGAGGDGNERPVDAILAAIGSESANAGCNTGFVRHDAVLVITYITDEDDDNSEGDPEDWIASIVAAKGGRPDAVVVLGLVGDSDLDDGTCTQEQAGDAPRLRALAEGFASGVWASVCAPNYAEFFTSAVELIDGTCDDFVPQG